MWISITFRVDFVALHSPEECIVKKFRLSIIKVVESLINNRLTNLSRSFSPTRRDSQKYILRKSSSVGMERNKFSNGLPVFADSSSSVTLCTGVLFEEGVTNLA